MPRSVVADADGILVFAGVLEGRAPADVEVLALDWSAITVGRSSPYATKATTHVSDWSSAWR